MNYHCFFSVAPMMGWSDRHCRFLHRLLSMRARLYTEMVVSDAIIHGSRSRHLDYNDIEHPIALQLGGSDPAKLSKAAKIAIKWGYDEINLNVGCPSDRVQSGTFGACLMRQPALVGDCIDSLKQSVDIPITVKCRLGVDDQDTETALSAIASSVFSKGCDGLWVHARKAWLDGLSPKENRNVPPLDYDRVIRLKRDYPDNFIGLNGALRTYDQLESLRSSVDGFMVGREAYQNPIFLRSIDRLLYNESAQSIDYATLCDRMTSYAKSCVGDGVRLTHIVRPMLGLFQGYRGAKQFRRLLSQDILESPSDVGIIERAFTLVLSQNDGVLQ